MSRRAAVRRRPPIAILTDFGYRDHYVGAMKAVIATLAPDARVIDVTHGIPAQSVVAGALALRECWRYFPADTIFLCVVDPGVGTARLGLAIETDTGARFVAPDNGLVSLAVEQAGLKRAVELRSVRYRLSKVSSTFHGRDIFAPAAAWLWRGKPLDAMGPRLAEIRRLSLGEPLLRERKLVGAVVYVDGFGNLVTNIGRDALARLQAGFPGRRLSVRIGRGAPLTIVNAYGDAPQGAALATFGSFELLEIAVRDASAAERFGAAQGAPVTVTASPGLRNG